MGFFGIFKNRKLTRVINQLKANNLDTMVDLLKDSKYIRYSDERIRQECDMLNSIFDLKEGPANESLNRFKWAKDICIEHDFKEGADFMQNYIRIYELYIKEYCN
jgi:hypothetical protein